MERKNLLLVILILVGIAYLWDKQQSGESLTEKSVAQPKNKQPSRMPAAIPAVDKKEEIKEEKVNPAEMRSEVFQLEEDYTTFGYCLPSSVEKCKYCQPEDPLCEGLKSTAFRQAYRGIIGGNDDNLTTSQVVSELKGYVAKYKEDHSEEDVIALKQQIMGLFPKPEAYCYTETVLCDQAEEIYPLNAEYQNYLMKLHDYKLERALGK